jgi:hypothetical protein
MTESLPRGDQLLMTELSQLSRDLSDYVRRTVEADRLDVAAVVVTDEWWLGVRLTRYGAVVRMRAERMKRVGDEPPF